MVLKLPKEIEDLLRKKQYGIFNHSAVQICSWTKKALKGEGVCYKKKFYNIDTHRCVEFTPLSMWCSQNCIFCWRPIEYMRIIDLDKENLDKPEKIIEGILEERRKLLSGFGGNKKVSKKMLDEALKPTHYAISLSGEPTLYPYITDLIIYLKSLEEVRSIFLVSNAQEERAYENFLNNPNALPTQFYVSLDAPNEKLFSEINRSVYKNGWVRLNRNLQRFSNFNTRKVIRLTIIKGINDKDEYLKEFANLIEMSKTDFIEAKAYMHLGLSQKRLSKENMPSHNDIKKFAIKLERVLENYKIVNEMEESRIVLLKRIDSPYNDKIIED